MTRSQIVNAFNFEVEEVAQYFDATLFLTVVVFLILVCNCFTVLTKKFQDCCIRPIWLFPLFTVILIEIVSSIFLLILALTGKE